MGMHFVLVNIRSAWNVGAIMRTADAVGASVILVGYTPKPEGATLALVKKTAIGAENSVTWEHFENYRDVIDRYPMGLKNQHLAIDISDTSQDILEYLYITKEIDVHKQFLWFGNEISGLEQSIVKELDAELHLPMVGMKESLNVASSVCAVAYLMLAKSRN